MSIRLLALVITIYYLFVTCFAEEQRDISKDVNIFGQFLNRLRTFFYIKNDRFAKRAKKLKEAFQAFRDKLAEDDDKRLLRLGVPLKKEEIPLFPPKRHKDVDSGLPPKTVHVVDPTLDTEHLIAAHGYISKAHTVVTKDGYLLTMHRILPTKYKFSSQKRVVLMHHGLFGSSDDWLLIGENKALPYLLTDHGFDVWLLNARGNKYSKSHTMRNAAHQDFWDFSFHEIGMYDLPAAMRYVSHIKEDAEIHYVGHSLGTSALLVLLSMYPEYNSKLKSAVLLAPLAFMRHAKGPITVLSHLYNKQIHKLLRILGKMEFSRHSKFPRPITASFCEGTEKACSNPFLLLCNGGRTTANDSLMTSILEHVPGGGSVKTLIHYMQLVESGHFRAFDYGEVNNIKAYGKSPPPAYDLRNVSVPMAVFNSPKDWLSTESDIETLLPLLSAVTVHHVVRSGNIDHLGFFWSPDVPELVYDFVYSALSETIRDELW